MGEVKTPPVAATHLPKKDDFRDEYGAGRVPGGFRIVDKDEDGVGTAWLWYCCPCGCGTLSPLLVGNGFKPADSPSWQWNGSLDKPTLQPSVHHVGHWHGYLTDGVWLSC